MSKRKNVDDFSCGIYVKTLEPNALRYIIMNCYRIALQYRKSSKCKYETVATNGYPTKEDAEADSIWFRNAYENGDYKFWTPYLLMKLKLESLKRES